MDLPIKNVLSISEANMWKKTRLTFQTKKSKEFQPGND
jgi:hypothetical protein